MTEERYSEIENSLEKLETSLNRHLIFAGTPMGIETATLGIQAVREGMKWRQTVHRQADLILKLENQLAAIRALNRGEVG